MKSTINKRITAYYSEKQAAKSKTFLYRDGNGTEFVVSEVSASPDFVSAWDDAVKLPTVGYLTYVKTFPTLIDINRI